MDITVNASFAELIGSRLVKEATVPPALLAWLERTSFIAREGCFFFDTLYDGRGNATISMFPDETGYECYVNHLHIDEPEIVKRILSAVGFLYAADVKWRRSEFGSHPIRHILSFAPDLNDCVYRYHIVRPGQRWLAEDIDSYHDYIFTAMSRRPPIQE